MQDDFSATERRVRRAMLFRVVLLLFGLYAFFALDRGNVGLAALEMNADLGLSAATYGVGASVFTLAYLIFQVPATTAMRRVGASRGLAAVACGWGAASMLTAFVWDAWSFLAIRALLGFAEAGFGAFIVFYISQTFPRSMRGLALSSTLVAVPITMMIASPISGWMLQWTHAGLRGWQWLFLVEGAPAIILGLLCLRFIPDEAGKADFLGESGKAWLIADLAAEPPKEHAPTKLGSFKDAARSPTVWALGITLFSTVLGTNTLLFWMPQMIERMSAGSTVVVGWLNAIPWLAFAIGMLVMGRLSDRITNKVTILSVAMLIASFGFAVGALSSSVELGFVGLLAGAFGVGATMALFWTVPIQMLGGAGLAGALAAINMIGNSSGVFAHGLIGWLRDNTGGFSATLLALGGVLILAVLLLNAFSRLRSPTDQAMRESRLV